MALYFLLIYIVVQFFGIKKNGPGAPQPDTHHLVTAAHRPWAVSESVSCEFGQEALVHILAGSHPFQKKKRAGSHHRTLSRCETASKHHYNAAGNKPIGIPCVISPSSEGLLIAWFLAGSSTNISNCSQDYHTILQNFIIMYWHRKRMFIENCFLHIYKII